MLVQHLINVRNNEGQIEEIRVTVVVDTAAIARELGAKAYKSKGRKSKALHGAVLVAHGPL